MRRSEAGTDEQLMAQTAAGDTVAFAQLYDRYRGRAYAVARRICGDRTLVEEAVQDGFLCAWRSRDSYSVDRGTVGAWLLTVVRHRAIDATRRNAKHARRRASERFIEQRPGAAADLLEQTIRRAEGDQLHRVLEEIPAAQREVIDLAYFAQLTHVQIAARLALPAGTVKGRIRLGLEKLRVESGGDL